MRMQDKANGDSEKKSVGGISEQSVLQPQDERKAVQRRTFTRWMNVFLQRRDPPVEVHDLFTEIQDGQILMALLEELSGCKLLYRFRSSSQRIFRLNNISKALAFLDDRHVKLPGIDASGIADGIPSAVLNLVWNIILYFQVKEVSRGLQRHLSSSLSSLSTSSYPISSDLSPHPNDIGSYSCNTLPSKGRKAAREPQYHGKAIKTLLQWVQQCTSKFGVEVRNFGRSWRSGLAFLAMIKSINPDLVDLRESLTKQPRENIQLAFTLAHHSLDIPPLLEPEDVSGSSPDEQSIITYVSMFLYHCSDIDEDHTTDIEIAEIPSFGSLESVSSGETHADDPKAQALVQGLKKSSEQLLWKRWARRSSGSPLNTLLHTGEATSPFNKKKSRSQSILQPPSPLDAGVVSQEIQSWMENVSVDQGDSKSKVDESNLSLSSEEGIYSLSALDSDEEDAYSYILDLNKEVFQPYNQLKRQVARVEEETEEDMFLSGEQTEESKHPNACKKTLNGSEHQEDSLAQHVEPEVRAQSGVHRTFQWDKSESSPREMAHSAAVFDTEPEEDSRSKEERGDERVVRGQSNERDYYEEEMIKEITEYTRLVEHGCDEREALMGETKNSKLFDLDSWKIEVEKETEGGLREKCGQVIENNKKEEENVPKFEEGQKRKSGKEQEEEDKDEERETQQSVVNLERFKVGLNEIKTTDEIVYEVRGAGATRINTKEENDGKENGMDMEELTSEDDEEDCSDDVMNSEVRAAEQKDRNLKVKRQELTGKTATIAAKTAPRNETNGGVNVHGVESFWTPAWPATSQSFREGGFIPQPSAAPCDITPFELEMLLVLWILLYCCFIF